MQTGVPIEPARAAGSVRVACWHHPDRDDPHAEAHITVGRLSDGRWWVETTAGVAQARAYHDDEHGTARQHAWAVVRNLMAGVDPWVPVPANYDAQGVPVPPDGWVKVGSRWVRKTAPDPDEA